MSGIQDYKLPDFLRGAATSSFQIEGGIENDMTTWEKQGRFKTNGLNPLVGRATDHWLHVVQIVSFLVN